MFTELKSEVDAEKFSYLDCIAGYGAEGWLHFLSVDGKVDGFSGLMPVIATLYFLQRFEIELFNLTANQQSLMFYYLSHINIY